MIVGFAGLKGAGKDTAARMLRELAARRGWETYHLAFADALRHAASAMFGLTPEQMSDRVLKEKPLADLGGRTPRELLQLLGTEVGRTIDEEMWVRACMRKARGIHAVRRSSLRQVPTLVTITDVRFDNEVAAIQAEGGRCVYVRPGLDRLHDLDRDGHASERMATTWYLDGVPDGVYTLHAGDTLDVLRDRVEGMADVLGVA